MGKWEDITAAIEYGNRILAACSPCGFERSIIGSMVEPWLYENGDIGVFVAAKPTPDEMEKLVAEAETFKELLESVHA